MDHEAATEDNDDLQLTIECLENPEFTCNLTVSKALIYNASSVLRRKIQSALSRNLTASNGLGTPELRLKEDPDAFKIFIQIVSSKNDRVPRKLVHFRLFRLAELTLKYDLCNCLGGWPALWIMQCRDNLKDPRGNANFQTDWLSICHAFRLADLLR